MTERLNAHPRRGRQAAARMVAMVLLVGAVGCTKGQTGSPFAEPPNYEGPEQFTPDSEGGSVGSDSDSGLRPPYQLLGGERARLRGSQLVVISPGTSRDRSRRGPELGLHVLDVSGASPVEVGEMPLRGRYHGMVLGDGWAAVALNEAAEIEATAVPEVPVPETTSRLILVDLSDPSSPNRLASVDLPGDVWRLEQRDGAIVALQEVVENRQSACAGLLSWTQHPPTTTMVVQAFTRKGDELVQLDRKDLAANLPYALATDGAYFAETHHRGDDQPAYELAWTTFAGTKFSEGGELRVEGLVRDVAREGDLVATLDHHGRLDLFSLSGGQSRLGRLAFGASGRVEALSASLLSVTLEQGVSLVDVSTPSNPTVVHAFSSEVARVQATPHGVLSVGPSSTGHLVVGQWDVSSPGAPSLVSRVEAGVPYSAAKDVGSPALPSFVYDAIQQRFLIPSHAYVGDQSQAWLTVVSVSGTALTLLGEQALNGAAHRPLTDTDEIFIPQGMDLVSFKVPSPSDPSPELITTTLKPSQAVQPIDRVGIQGLELSAWSREDGVFVVRQNDGSGGLQEVEMSHWVDDLVLHGDRVVVVGLRGHASECESFEQMGMEPVEVPDAEKNCASHRARGISVLSVGDTLEVQATFPVSADKNSLGNYEESAFWAGYVSLPDGSLGFPVEYIVRCNSREQCEELGAEAFRSVSSPGCNPEAEDCSELPTTEEHWSGALRLFRIYVLDLDAPEGPALVLAAEKQGAPDVGGDEAPLDLSWQVIQHESGVGFARVQPLYNEDGNSLRDESDRGLVRYFLDRLLPADTGGWAFAESINTPGLPVAWVSDEVFSVEPRYPSEDAVAATLHRSLIRNRGAFIRDSAELDGSFHEARRRAGTVYLALGDKRYCADSPRGTLLPVGARAGALELGSPLHVPYGLSFPRWSSGFHDDELWLQGGTVPGATLIIDISEPLAPALSRYTTAP